MKTVTREIPKILALMSTLLLILGSTAASEQEKPAAFVNRIVVDGTINPAVAGFIQDSIRVSHQGSARALVIELDTPGGLLSSTRTIVKDILGAPLPVIVYVAPSGAGAGSAGLFLTLSAHVAVMAPGTHIGAAHPVGGGGQEVSRVLGEKLENFVASYGKAIAQQRGRNLDWAVKAIRESVAVTEVEALQLNVVDFVAKDLDDLFHQVTGRQIEVGGQRIVLELTGVEARTLEMSLTQKFVNLIADPNIAYLLMMIGIIGLYLEMSNPGLIFPGVLGAICILLGMAALQLLPVNYAGLALLFLGGALLLAEAFVPSFGMLGIGGLVSLVLGSLMLFDVAGERLIVDRSIIFTVAAVAGGLMLAVGYLIFKTQRSKPAMGKEVLIGEVGRVVARVAPGGKVRIHGEIWTAESDQTLEVGEAVVISQVEDLRLRVQRVEAATQRQEGREDCRIRSNG